MSRAREILARHFTNKAEDILGGAWDGQREMLAVLEALTPATDDDAKWLRKLADFAEDYGNFDGTARERLERIAARLEARPVEWELRRANIGGRARGWQVLRNGSPVSGLFDERDDAEAALREFRAEAVEEKG